MLRSARLLVVFALLSLACSGGAGGPGGPGMEGGEEAPKRQVDPRTLVTVAAVGPGEVAATIQSTGVVESEAQADLTPEASGTVISISVEEGDTVKRGQVLAVIQNASLDAAYERAKAELARAERELAQVESLHKSGAVSDTELNTARDALNTAKTTLAEARSSAGHLRLVSPIDGTVALRDLRYGEVAGGKRAFQVVDLDRLRIVVKLPERDLSRLQVGQLATLTPVYDAEVHVAAELIRLSPTVDATTGTVRATLALPKGERTLRPGQFVSASLETERRQAALVVPREAVVYDDGQAMVYRVTIEEPPKEEAPKEDEKKEGEEEEKKGFSFSFGGEGGEGAEEEKEVELPGPYRVARKVPVELGLSDEDTTEIVSGLNPGDEVVVVGQANLRDGARVRFEADPRLEDVIAEEEAKKKAEAEKAEADGTKADGAKEDGAEKAEKAEGEEG
ncbi:MAG: efflux RND transporter periplasmic adaptor subunit [Deltaproteobacteria bacterium]|nr:efflux RND transporter periplasmic adaptor subunit [Deltaproteobacteria bacterium]